MFVPYIYYHDVWDIKGTGELCITATIALGASRARATALRRTPITAGISMDIARCAAHRKIMKGKGWIGLTTKDMEKLVNTARSYERSRLLMEKVLRLEAHIKEMKKMGADDEWLQEQTRQLELQRARMQHLRVTGSLAHTHLQQIMGEITDDYLYQILSRHFLQGHTWVQIAAAVGGGNSPDSVRKAAARYLATIN